MARRSEDGVEDEIMDRLPRVYAEFLLDPSVYFRVETGAMVAIRAWAPESPQQKPPLSIVRFRHSPATAGPRAKRIGLPQRQPPRRPRCARI